jgi:hypothetical protein
VTKPVRLPRSQLAADLAAAAVIKANMMTLLRELEEQVTGRSVTKPGHWRHHPRDWAESNPPRD